MLRDAPSLRNAHLTAGGKYVPLTTMRPDRSVLEPGEVHVWYATVEEAYESHVLEAYKGLLTPDERARHDRFYFEHSKLEFLVTRALVRTALSRYRAVDPRDWRFEANAHGRPSIAHPRSDEPHLFNLSNTHGFVACLISGAREGGIDVEDAMRNTETVEIAHRFFAPSEVAALKALPPSEHRERFFTYWTLKEAYIKARGMGLAIPLDKFAFELDGANVRIRIDPSLHDDERTWQFARSSPTPRHRVAVAVRGDSEAGPKVVVREAYCPLR